MDLNAYLPTLLPRAVAWAEAEESLALASGYSLSRAATEVARRIGVAHPELVRVAIVDELPMPGDPLLHAAAVQTGLLGPHMAGLTLGHAVLVKPGEGTWRLLAHEFRHVFQYEQAGSIAAFLPEYLRQIVQVGYAGAPFECDARAHECFAPIDESAPKFA